MIELAWSVHARVELLLAVIVAITAVRFEQMTSAICEDDAVVAAIERDGTDQALIDEVVQAVVSAIETLIARIEIVLRDDTKSANGRERSTVFAVQFVDAIAVEYQLAFQPAWQVKTIEKCLTWIVAALA